MTSKTGKIVKIFHRFETSLHEFRALLIEKCSWKRYIFFNNFTNLVYNLSYFDANFAAVVANFFACWNKIETKYLIQEIMCQCSANSFGFQRTSAIGFWKRHFSIVKIDFYINFCIIFLYYLIHVFNIVKYLGSLELLNTSFRGAKCGLFFFFYVLSIYFEQSERWYHFGFDIRFCWRCKDFIKLKTKFVSQFTHT